MNVAKNLMQSTTSVAATLDADAAGLSMATPNDLSATPFGSLVTARGEFHEVEAELCELRRRLAQHDGSLPSTRIDAKHVAPSRWANRIEASFKTAAFARLKEDIAASGGNVQPILVRRAADMKYDVVFGHRRHRACLELGLPVLCTIWAGPMSDAELLVVMDRENRERVDPSVYEQGASYLAALDAGLFPSQRRLSEALGVSHTWVAKALAVAKLPREVIEAFESPSKIQPAHASVINTALVADASAVLARAEALALRPARETPQNVVATLVGLVVPPTQRAEISVNGLKVGTWARNRRGHVVIELGTDHSSDEAMKFIAQAISAAAGKSRTFDRTPCK